MLSAKARDGLAPARASGEARKAESLSVCRESRTASKAALRYSSLRGVGWVGIILAARPPAGDERGVSQVASAAILAGRQPGRHRRREGGWPAVCCSPPACCSASSSAASPPH